jgi:hypothetical protein
MGFELHKPPEAWIKGLIESHWASAVIPFSGRVFAVRFARIPLHSNLPEESGDIHYEKNPEFAKKNPFTASGSPRLLTEARKDRHQKSVRFKVLASQLFDVRNSRDARQYPQNFSP